MYLIFIFDTSDRKVANSLAEQSKWEQDRSDSLWQEIGCYNGSEFIWGISYKPLDGKHHEVEEMACEVKRACDKKEENWWRALIT